MKRLTAILLALLFTIAVVGCGKPAAAPAETAAKPAADSDWAYVQQKGKLIVGITEYEPMNYYDTDGTLIGFDTEFTKAVCAKLGVEPEFVVIDWDSKELELKNKNIDCIWNGLTINEERKANMDFSTSYLKNQQVVVIRAADKDTYTAVEAFDGKTVVAEGGSAGAAAIAADMPNAAFTEMGAQADALLEVKSGTAEAAVIDLTMAKAMTGAGTDYADLMIVTSIDMMDEEYAIGFRVGSDITAKVNEIIATLAADGTLAALAEKYALTDLLIAG